MASVFAAALSVMAVVSFAVLMIVMMAGFIRIVLQRSVQIGRDDIVRSAVYAGQKLHASFLQRHPRAHTNAAADQGLHFCRAEKTRQGSVSRSIRINNLRSLDRAVLHVIDFELLGPSEMLSHHFLFIGHCDSHNVFSFFIDLG